MSDTFERVTPASWRRDLFESPRRGYDELMADDTSSRGIVTEIGDGKVVEKIDPNYPKGPCVLVLQRDRNGNPIHVV